MKEKGLYVHIPFCARKCNYCDFTSYVPIKNEIDFYLDSLEREMKMYNMKNEVIKTIFIGGGTPTILNLEQLRRLFEIISSEVNLENVEEYTIEANPGTLDIEKLKVIKAAGVNRLSIGLQAIQDRNLKFMGRIHNLKDFEESYDNARKVGFDNINVDLIFAFYGQTLEDWKETLEYIVSKNPEHISAYSLIIEEGTDFYNRYENGDITDFDENSFVKMYRYTVNYLAENRYKQYEISNFSKNSLECKHNIKYWLCEEYFGIGVSASGYLNGKRYTNVKTLEKYAELTNSNVFPKEFEEQLTYKDIFNEKIMLGLRMNEGINFSLIDEIENEILKKFIEKTIDKYEKKGYIEIYKDDAKKVIKLTQSGREISNIIILDLML
ncbi:oxygen-independent coproporphyrinogen-3 oxidase [Peptostreptococcus russellii]|uniref:Heme chaperone HemW n=1 Tax=Peptostreptococcus russellii TaxID=215200 RepID=A0A1H8FDD3_9FIRM|nr:radical SAM family heme chaperone HemW [Peptostreptococcus russellii]SEN29692.1 oxygen-independent coproporphyrinogen-3 oxidase [Peptostreptococcus russellii]